MLKITVKVIRLVQYLLHAFLTQYFRTDLSTCLEQFSRHGLSSWLVTK
jgi:hypothetical protein